MAQGHYIVTIALRVAKALGFNCILLVFQNQLIIIVSHNHELLYQFRPALLLIELHNLF